MNTDIDLTERKTLWVTVFANLSMAIAAWYTYHLSNSQAILLDGNFSFVLAIATLIAIYISKNKHKKTAIFPYGGYVYEAAFVLSKGLLILGIIVMAFFQNASKIIGFLQGDKIEAVIMTPIYYYTFSILFITALLLLFFWRQNKRINNKSDLLKVEAKSAKIDGILTLSMGFSFFLISLIPNGSKLDFFIYIGDSIIVIIISILVLASPIKIIKTSFIELGGGILHNKKEKEEIEKVIEQVVSNDFSYKSYITKTGSGYLVILHIDPNTKSISIEHFLKVQQEIKKELKNNYSTLLVEISLKDKE